MKLYINGILQDNSYLISGDITVPPTPMTIGANPGLSNSFSDFLEGEIDEVAIYSEALSAQEIESLYKNSREGHGSDGDGDGSDDDEGPGFDVGIACLAMAAMTLIVWRGNRRT
jgi:hypothetical protein